MNAAVYKTISTIGFTMAGVMLVVTVILFFKLNVLKLVGELTGRTALKEIEEISQQTMSYKTGSLKRRRNGASAYLSRKILQERIILDKNDTGENKIQGDDVTEPLFTRKEEVDKTQPLEESRDSNETQVLATTEKLGQWMRVPIKNADARFEIIKDEVLVHTDDTAETELLNEEDKNF